MQDVIPVVKEFDSSLTRRMQNPNDEYYQDVMQSTEEKYQNITYWKHGKFETVSGLEFIPISVEKAISKAQDLLPEYEEGIGFTNGGNKDAIHFIRKGKNYWRATVPVFTRREWDGYYYQASSDTKGVMDVIRLFFDELDWFGMLDFKLRRNTS